MKTSATADKSASFAELVDYEPLYADFAAVKKVVLNDEEKTEYQAYWDKHLKKWDGNKWLGSSVGASATSLIYKLFALIQSLTGLDFGNLGSSFSSITSKTDKAGVAFNIGQAACAVDEDLKNGVDVNGTPLSAETQAKFRMLADFGCGVTENNSDFAHNNIYSQLYRATGLKSGFSSSLNNNGVGKQNIDDVSVQSSLPNLKQNTNSLS